MLISAKRYIDKKVAGLAIAALDRVLLTSPRQNIDLIRVARAIAAYTSGQFFLDEMPLAQNFTGRRLLSVALDNTTVQELVLEFGVWKGASIKRIAERVRQTVYGFDSFRGVDKDWQSGQDMRHFDLGGKPPENVPSNVKFVVGYFEETLPQFVAEHDEPVSFVHIDSDIYDSAKTVLNNLGRNIVPGTIILFGDYINYPTWKQHEHKAFRESVEAFQVRHEYIGFASQDHSVCYKIL